MQDIVLKNIEIESKIREIRGKQVIIDSDLAKLYHCTNGTKEINQAVKRNIERFPDDFRFQLTEEEYKYLKSQFVTSSLKNTYGGVRKLPYAYTEQGVAMLASVLKTKIAAEVSIDIMRTFVAMRHYLTLNKDIYKALNNINNQVSEHDDKLNYLFSRFDLNGKVFLKGDFYNEYSYMKDILEMSKDNIIIIDPYIDKKILDLVRNIDVKIVIICSNKSKLTETEILEFNKSYNKLSIIRNDSFHDRFFIIDNKEYYHIGTSINYAGNKVNMVDRIEDIYIKEAIQKEIEKIDKNSCILKANMV